MKGTILAAALLAVAQGALAQVPCTTLIYVGAPFTSVTTTGPTPGAINSPLTGAIMLASPLPPNAVNLAVTAASWDFSSEYPDLNSATVGGAPWDAPTFAFSTDANGAVTAWNTTLRYFLGPGTQDTYNISATSTPSGDSITIDSNSPSVPGGPSTITASSSAPGAWTCIGAYSATITTLQAQVTTLQATVAADQAQVAALQATVATAQAQIAALQAQLAALQAQAAKLTTEVNALIAERNAIEAQEAAVAKKLAAATARLAADTLEIAKLKAEIAVLKGKH